MTRRRWWAAGAAALVSVMAAANAWLVRAGGGVLYSSVDAVPVNEVGLVLGTNPRYSGGVNPFFETRMDAAAALFHAGKVRYLLLSGDHGRVGYNEPAAMRRALFERGVPCEAMVLDYAGFRTLDSMARARTVFGQRRLTVVSQEFHNHRALFLARHFGIEAVAFNAPAVVGRVGWKTQLREWIARPAALVDTWVLRRGARFHGPAVAIPAVSESDRARFRTPDGIRSRTRG